MAGPRLLLLTLALVQVSQVFGLNSHESFAVHKAALVVNPSDASVMPVEPSTTTVAAPLHLAAASSSGSETQDETVYVWIGVGTGALLLVLILAGVALRMYVLRTEGDYETIPSRENPGSPVAMPELDA